MCLEGDLGEGMCAMGKWGSGPYASEIYLLFPVMKLMKQIKEAQIFKAL